MPPKHAPVPSPLRTIVGMAPALYPRPPSEPETYPSAALGIRLWRVFDRGEPLRSSDFGDGAWQVGVTRAECTRGCPSIPNTVWDDSDIHCCRCGLHAYHSMDHLLARQRPHVTLLARGELVIGIVAGKGNMQIHEDGWRAEKAQILGLLAPPRPCLYVCPGCDGLAPEHCLCAGTGTLAGAVEEVGMVREDLDHEAVRARVDEIASHHGVPVFDTLEQMMLFGRGLATPAAGRMRVPHAPIWARSWWRDSVLATWLGGLLALFATVGLVVFQVVAAILDGGHPQAAVVSTAASICGRVTLACVLLAACLWTSETVLRRRARRLWDGACAARGGARS